MAKVHSLPFHYVAEYLCQRSRTFPDGCFHIHRSEGGFYLVRDGDIGTYGKSVTPINCGKLVTFVKVSNVWKASSLAETKYLWNASNSGES